MNSPHMDKISDRKTYLEWRYR